jgi:hypothetical protein
MRGERESCGVKGNEYSCAHHVTSTSIFNLWVPRYLEVGGSGEGNVEGEEVLVPRLVLDLARGGALDAILHAKLEHVRGRGHVYLVVGPF